jgi:hypothetical protein
MITLNLYEERYLAMAEYIRAQPTSTYGCRIFGIMYCSDKPQVIKNGTGHVVPFVTKGDIGVVCVVESVEEAVIPTIGGGTRRRIRLTARGAARFEIARVLHNGFDGVNEKREGHYPLPFILVESVLVLMSSPSDEEEDQAQCREMISNRLPDGATHCLELAVNFSKALNLNQQKESLLKLEVLTFSLLSSTLPDDATVERLEATRNPKKTLELIGVDA